VYVVRCNEYFNRKTFLADLLRAMHKDSGGYTVAEMMNTVVKEIRKADKPLIIMDEVDKLNDQVFYFIITLYNFLEGQCGIIIMATDHLEKRVKRGLSLNKKGYKEIYSRIGRKWITLKTPSTKDITAIVKANGIDDENAIASIINDAESDLRRVERLVHAEKLAA
jgi:Cdc6-like AAA superfamily ATPase